MHNPGGDLVTDTVHVYVRMGISEVVWLVKPEA